MQQVQKQSQSMVLAPQLQHSLKILQAPALELRSAILEELQTNPTLEELPMESVSLDDPGEPTEDGPEGELDFERDNFADLAALNEEWREQYADEAAARTPSTEEEERRRHFFESFVGESSLQEHLLAQADLTELGETERTALEYLLGSLDRDGFLTDTPENLALLAGVPLAALQRARQLLLGFDPIGVGAVDRRESLLVQLEAKGKGDTVAARLLREAYDPLLRRRLPEVARRCGVDTRQVRRALEEIATLDPAPGRRFAEDTNRVVVPDVRVYRDEDGGWQVVLNSDSIPRLRLSRTYKDLIATGQLPAAEREYLREKMRSGRFLMNSIEQRQQTVERIVRELLVLQEDFFVEGVARLRPLTMNRVAERIGVHETTVSRAIANKYIETPHGVFPLKYFFTAGYTTQSGEEVSSRGVKEVIQQIIDQEDPTKPHSDQTVVRLLAERGFPVARRTVAKYRDELGILPTHLRRTYSAR
jgi:RNA polymerase sigma-54 factor